MNYTVYEGRVPVGELSIEPAGLYYEIRCKLNKTDAVRRLYGIRGMDTICLGIPDGNGELQRWVPRKYVAIPDRVIVSATESGKWRPWSGEDFGPMLYDCFLRPTGNGWSVAMDPAEWEQLPQWKDIGKKENVAGRHMVRVDFDAEKQPPLIERKNGGEKDEVHTQNIGNDIDPLLLADLPADYDYGGTDTEEADRHHL